MKPSKRRSRKKKKPSSPAEKAEPSPSPAQTSNPSSSPQAETLTLTDSGDASTSASTSSSSASTTSSSAAAGDERRDLAFLLDAFASASIDEIESAYRDAGGDASLAAGILGSFLEPPAPPPPPDPSPKANSGGKKGGRKARRVVAVAATGMVADVIGRGYTKPAAAKSNPWKGRSGEVEAAPGGGGGGRRYSIEEAEQFLCSMLGDNSELGLGVVRDVLGQYGRNVEKALDALLDISGSSHLQNKERLFPGDENISIGYPGVCPRNGISDKDSSTENKRTSLQSTDMNPNMSFRCSETEHDSRIPFNIFFLGCRGYSKDLPDSERPQAPYSSTLSPSRSTISKPNVQQKVLESLFKIPEIPTYEPNTMDWKKVVKKLQQFEQGSEFSSTDLFDNQEKPKSGKVDGYQEFRGVAARHYGTMRTYYQKAALAYTRGERSYASYLAEEAKHYRELGRKADEKASREIFEARNKHITNTITIDLHGQHVKQAMRLLKVHMLVCVCMPSVLLRVITGCGVDGPGKGKIKRAVIDLVEKEGIKWSEENSGTIAIRLGGPREYTFTEHDSDLE